MTHPFHIYSSWTPGWWKSQGHLMQIFSQESSVSIIIPSLSGTGIRSKMPGRWESQSEPRSSKNSQERCWRSTWRLPRATERRKKNRTCGAIGYQPTWNTISLYFLMYTLPEINIASVRRRSQKEIKRIRKIIFQPQRFRCYVAYNIYIL